MALAVTFEEDAELTKSQVVQQVESYHVDNSAGNPDDPRDASED